MNAADASGRDTLRIGLALGAGAARGWAHVGIIRELAAAGIVPNIICGCSIGALVGAAYVVGRFDAFADWVVALTRREALGLLDPVLSGGGLIRGERLLRFLRERYDDLSIEDSPVPFGAVATDLANGRETWLREGSLFDAVHASVAIPGLFCPVHLDGRWLVDGGLVNPVPVSLCRAMGAEFIIAVNLSTEGPRAARNHHLPPPSTMLPREWAVRLRNLVGGGIEGVETPEVSPAQPDFIGVATTALSIMQDFIARSRLSGDPPHIMLCPMLGHIGMLEFDRGADAVEEGRQCALRMLPALRASLAGFVRQ